MLDWLKLQPTGAFDNFYMDHAMYMQQHGYRIRWLMVGYGYGMIDGTKPSWALPTFGLNDMLRSWGDYLNVDMEKILPP